jgi:hypothetical protein
MEPRRVREIFESLVQGTDPDTGAALPSDSIVQRSTVLRALLAGIEAIELAERRAARRAHLPKNVGRSWSEPEIATLRREFESGMSIEQVASAHGRTLKAITARLEQMGLIAAQIDGWNPISALGISRSAKGRGKSAGASARGRAMRADSSEREPELER